MNAAATQNGNEPILLEALDDGVLRLVLNRPAARNALSVASTALPYSAAARSAAA